jgi:hypothetical protein
LCGRRIRAADVNGAAPPEVQDNAAPAAAALDRFERLLEASDYRAMAAFRELHGALAQQLGDAVKEIETCMQGFDCERALAALRRLRAATVA